MPAEDLVEMLKAAEGAGGLRCAWKAFVMDSLQAAWEDADGFSRHIIAYDVVAEVQRKQHKQHSPWSGRVSSLIVGTVRV